MQTRKSMEWAVFAIGVGSLALAILVVGSRGLRAAPNTGPTAVTVTNTPLPVNGSVAASQLGAWTVNIDGTPAVQVVPTPSQTFRREGGNLDNLSATMTAIVDNVSCWTTGTNAITIGIVDASLTHSVQHYFIGQLILGTANIYQFNTVTRIQVRANETMIVPSTCVVEGHYE